MPKTTIHDVANHAGVSTATVSHVINKTRFVMDETRNKVLKSVEILGYTPNVMARNFKQGRRNLIGFIVPDIVNVFYSAIVEEAESTIAKHNYRLVTTHTKETKTREANSIKALASGIVDGLIVTSTMQNYAEIANLAEDGFPMVFIDRMVPNCLCDTVLINNYFSVFDGVTQLISDGHRKIGYITGLPHLSTTHERLNAYKDALTNSNITVDNALICSANSMRQSAVPQAQQLLQLGCTALVVANNVMTEDVLFFLQENGVPIGQKNGIDIVGYNDSGDIYHIMHNIHSINQPTKAMGRAAGEQIINRILHPKSPANHIVLQATLTKKRLFSSQKEEKSLKWNSIINT